MSNSFQSSNSNESEYKTFRGLSMIRPEARKMAKNETITENLKPPSIAFPIPKNDNLNEFYDKFNNLDLSPFQVLSPGKPLMGSKESQSFSLTPGPSKDSQHLGPTMKRGLTPGPSKSMINSLDKSPEGYGLFVDNHLKPYDPSDQDYLASSFPISNNLAKAQNLELGLSLPKEPLLQQGRSDFYYSSSLSNLNNSANYSYNNSHSWNEMPEFSTQEQFGSFFNKSFPSFNPSNLGGQIEGPDLIQYANYRSSVKSNNQSFSQINEKPISNQDSLMNLTIGEPLNNNISINLNDSFANGQLPALVRSNTPPLSSTRSSKSFTENDLFLPKKSEEFNFSNHSSRSNLSTIHSLNNKLRNSKDTNPLALSIDKSSIADLRSSNDTLRSSLLPKQDLCDSPPSKEEFKKFCNEFRSDAKIEPDSAEAKALKKLEELKPNNKWKAYVELAEFAKKNNDIDKAREYYIKACFIEKKAANVWLEWSKMEEENGRPEMALKIIQLGLNICKLNDTLLPRLVKLHEKLHQYTSIRGILSPLKHEGVERTWKSILEGCLFEARVGNGEVSRKVFKYLMNTVSWYGPIYYEAFRLEERENKDENALKIIRRGLTELPRYGPLWFGLLKIMERTEVSNNKVAWQQGKKPTLNLLSAGCEEAIKNISKELTWRVYYEKFQAQERAAEIASQGCFNRQVNIHGKSQYTLAAIRNILFQDCRTSLIKSILLCPANLRWKLFLVGARLELGVKKIAYARKLILRAMQEVPSKSKASVFIEASRLEEYIGNIEIARSILLRAKGDLNSDWRIFYEAILLETRQGNTAFALELAHQAIQVHNVTGRLWSMYIQLIHRYEGSGFYFSPDPEYDHLLSIYPQLTMTDIIIRKAIQSVPKSGEVWCEYGRCYLNPFQYDSFDLSIAQRSFNYAIQFTPQYGDTFVEYLRLELIVRNILPSICSLVGVDYQWILRKCLYIDEDSDIYKDLQKNLNNYDPQLSSSSSRKNRKERMISIILGKQQYSKEIHNLFTEQYPFNQLQRRCINADPNYGSLWFHCRELPFDTPNSVLGKAQLILRQELISSISIYARAILWNIYTWMKAKVSERKTLKFVENAQEEENNGNEKTYIIDWIEDFESCKEHCENFFIEATSEELEDLPPSERPTKKKFTMLEMEDGELFCNNDFVTGIITLNRHIYSSTLSDELKRKYLLSIDQIVN